MPPASRMTAGFGRLVNVSDKEFEIQAFSSPEFESVSLHQTVIEDGISRMRSVPDISLAAGAELVLEPGGYHLMLMRPARGLTGVVEINVHMSDGAQIRFEVPVERR